MRTCIISKSYSYLRFTDKEDCMKYAEANGLKCCHILLIRDYMQCTFGFGVYDKNDELIGYDGVVKWI